MPDLGEAKPVGTPAGPPAAPPAAKPASKKTGTETSTPAPDKMRRRIIWSCIYGYLGVNFLMFLRFFFPRTLFEPKTIFSVGYPSDFAPGVETKFQRDYRIWVDRVPGRVFVIFARCTHLGCTPDWKGAENKFKCPCHGSGYDSEGVNFEGPAPRPMDRARVSLDPTGRIIVDTSILYVDDPKAGVNHFNDLGAYLNV
jgi:cytochrome b6-f complex iron-sulfur subunit